MSEQEPNELSQYSWVKPLVAGVGPRYLQIADLIGDAIRNGELSPGDQVPPQRLLATVLGVDLTTVTRAYSEARNRGLISSFSGRGSFVTSTEETTRAERIDLSMNIPPQPSERNIGDLALAAMAEVLKRQDDHRLSTYDTGDSNLSAIQAGQAWLRPAIGDLANGNLVMSPGTQAAIYAALQSASQKGDTVLCEPLTYPGFLLAARKLGLNVRAIDIDEFGATPDSIEEIHRATNARVIYLNPTLQNPTTRTMPQERRKEIANTLLKLEMTLIEDDPYWFLINDAPPPLMTFMRGVRTFYMASLSKCLWPSLRTSFVVTPDNEDNDVFLENLRSSGMGGSPLLYGLAEQWIRTGVARQIVSQVQREARARQSLARSILPKGACSHPCGLHTWLTLPPHRNRQVLADALEQRGIIVATADAFSAEPNPENGVRLSMGGATSQLELAHALKQVTSLLMEDKRRARTIV
ncbi:PLP-dependent aminotransferase family protein [Pseudomonas moorei]|nr:PLP-dependent aminotransferase family protein [Pseudomonas moorei]